MSLSLCGSPGCYGLADESSGIKQEWIGQAIETPGVKKEYDDGIRHYIRQIPKFDNRWLRVIINVSVMPFVLVTAFFDRRLG